MTLLRDFVNGECDGGYWQNALYGPQARDARARIASVILGRVIKPSHPEAQWGNFKNLLANALGVTDWTCINDQEKRVMAALGQTH